MNDQELEQEIQAKGLTAPRVTPAQIQAKIKKESCFTALTQRLVKRLPRMTPFNRSRHYKGIY